MTTPDLEGLAREHEEKADFHGNEANIWSQPGKMSAFRQQRASEEGALAQAHRQAAALIRSAPAPGREEISNEIHIALQRLHYADLLWIAGSADGFERATLAIADHLLSALFHAPADPGGGEDEGAVRTAGAKLLTALERYGFPVSDAASTAAMSVEARDLHNAARRFKIAITSIMRPADEPAVTNGQ